MFFKMPEFRPFLEMQKKPLYFKFYQRNTAGEFKITSGEQSSFSPSVPAEFAVSREGQPLGITNLDLEAGRGAPALRITAEMGGKPYSGLDSEVGLEGRPQRLALQHNYRILEHRSNRQLL